MTDKIIPVTVIGNKLSPLVKRLLFSNFIGNSASVGFLPSDISGLQLWLDALDFSSFTFNGSDVSQWNDKSGNSKNAIQTTAIEQPEFISNGLNSLPTVRWVHAGAAMGLEISGGLPIGLNVSRTMFMVINPNPTSELASEFLGKNTGNFVGFGTFKPPDDFDFTDRIRLRSTDTGFDINSEEDTVTYGTPHKLTVIGTGSGVEVFNNTTNILDDTDRPFSWNMAFDLGIGKSLDFGSRSYLGDISEILIYSKLLNSEENTNILNYLSRWGV